MDAGLGLAPAAAAPPDGVDISRARLDAVADLEGMAPVDATNDGVGAIRCLDDGRGADIVSRTVAVLVDKPPGRRAGCSPRAASSFSLFGIPAPV